MHRFVLLLAAILTFISPVASTCSAQSGQSTGWGWFATLSTPSSWWIVRGVGTDNNPWRQTLRRVALRGRKSLDQLERDDLLDLVRQVVQSIGPD
jgi:hypothetical protein